MHSPATSVYIYYVSSPPYHSPGTSVYIYYISSPPYRFRIRLLCVFFVLRIGSCLFYPDLFVFRSMVGYRFVSVILFGLRIFLVNLSCAINISHITVIQIIHMVLPDKFPNPTHCDVYNRQSGCFLNVYVDQ